MNDTTEDRQVAAVTERQRMIETYANCMLIWTIVEDQLANLLNRILHTEHGSFGPRLFFAVQTAQGREAMLKAAVEEFNSRHVHKRRLNSIWHGMKKQPGLLKRIETCREHRNRLAHRAVQIHEDEGVFLAGSVLFASVGRKGMGPTPRFAQSDLDHWLQQIHQCSQLVSEATKMTDLAFYFHTNANGRKDEWEEGLLSVCEALEAALGLPAERTSTA